MVDTSELESFLNEKSAKEDDIVEITEEGLLEEKEDPVTKRKYKVINLPVLVNGERELIWTPNKEAIKVLQKVKGLDTKDWIGIKFYPRFYPKTAFGTTRTAIEPRIINA